MTKHNLPTTVKDFLAKDGWFVVTHRGVEARLLGKSMQFSGDCNKPELSFEEQALKALFDLNVRIYTYLDIPKYRGYIKMEHVVHEKYYI